jgi:hypothetical protein
MVCLGGTPTGARPGHLMQIGASLPGRFEPEPFNFNSLIHWICSGKCSKPAGGTPEPSFARAQRWSRCLNIHAEQVGGVITVSPQVRQVWVRCVRPHLQCCVPTRTVPPRSSCPVGAVLRRNLGPSLAGPYKIAHCRSLAETFLRPSCPIEVAQSALLLLPPDQAKRRVGPS